MSRPRPHPHDVSDRRLRPIYGASRVSRAIANAHRTSRRGNRREKVQKSPSTRRQTDQEKPGRSDGQSETGSVSRRFRKCLFSSHQALKGLVMLRTGHEKEAYVLMDEIMKKRSDLVYEPLLQAVSLFYRESHQCANRTQIN